MECRPASAAGALSTLVIPMTQKTADVVQNGKVTKKPLVPPDEKFWKRYSPHHEAPLSGVSSLTLHILIPCVVALGLFLFKDRLDKAAKPIPLDVVAQGDPDAGGSGATTGVDGGKEIQPPEAVSLAN